MGKKWKSGLLRGVVGLCMALALIFQAAALEAEDAADMIYDDINPEGSVMLNTMLLGNVVSLGDAENVLQSQLSIMTTYQKQTASDISQIMLFTEALISKTASEQFDGGTLIISRDSVSDLELQALPSKSALSAELAESGVTTPKELFATVRFYTEEMSPLTTLVERDILESAADAVLVDTPTYSLYMKIADLAPDLENGPLTIITEDIGTEYEPGTTIRIPEIRVELPGGQLSNPITLLLSVGTSDPSYIAVTNSSGEAFSGRYNPASAKMEGIINDTGVYLSKSNERHFTDISHLDEKVQRAINWLAAHDIIKGTTPTTFSPESPLTRAQFVALMMRGLKQSGSPDNAARFSDVTRDDWYAGELAAALRNGIIDGFSDGTFRPKESINKTQMCVVTGRVLDSIKKVRLTASVNEILSCYKDWETIIEKLRKPIALVTQQDLVITNASRQFKGKTTMRRCDAAVMLYRMFCQG